MMEVLRRRRHLHRLVHRPDLRLLDGRRLMPPHAAREIWGRPDAAMAWGSGPQGRAIAVPGGYRVTGRWDFASGSRQHHLDQRPLPRH
jgi:hypothetical protein